ncbi:hypothetical protein GOP47_0027792 [Adiantum capillus-veneris]|nr:hypothetical protein GOP47_0027792 [Adiantum capillus-veneris]
MRIQCIILVIIGACPPFNLPPPILTNTVFPGPCYSYAAAYALTLKERPLLSSHPPTGTALGRKVDSFTYTTKRSIHAHASKDLLTEHQHADSNPRTADTPSSSSHSLSYSRYAREVAGLQARLEHDHDKRKALKSARGGDSSAPSKDITPLKRGVCFQDLVKEISMLELEIKNLEQHLLELYRQAFNQKSASSPYYSEMPLPVQSKFIKGDPCYVERQATPQGSSLWKRSANNTSKEKRSSYSQPISLPQGTPYLHNYSKSFVPKKPRQQVDSLTAYDANGLSEDIVLCMAAIYRRLAEPQVEAEVSPSSSFSTSTFSAAQDSSTYGFWASQHSEQSSHTGSSNDFEWSNIPRHAEKVDVRNFEVKSICIDDERLACVATMLRTFQSLVQQLESIDPGKLGREQKLAFWINIHNALMMHAYLAYGIPGSQSKRVALLQKAAYRIGAHSLNAQTIQRHILRCKSYRPAKRLHSIVSPASLKKLTGAERQAYAIQHPEPLLCFALSCGARSDPAVRIYTSKFIYQELEVAKHDFLSAHVSIHVGGKVSLPKILEAFARDVSMKPHNLLRWVANSVKDEVVAFKFQCNIDTMAGKANKSIEWMQYDFTFHYVFDISFARFGSM